MPEIKEIRKFADFIREKIKNKEILDINILNGRYKNHGPFTNFNVLKKELPLKVKEVKTKGKFLYIIFDKDLYLFNTMGLTGGWCYLENDKKDPIKKNAERSDSAVFFDSYNVLFGSQLFLLKNQLQTVFLNFNRR